MADFKSVNIYHSPEFKQTASVSDHSTESVSEYQEITDKRFFLNLTIIKLFDTAAWQYFCYAVAPAPAHCMAKVIAPIFGTFKEISLVKKTFFHATCMIIRDILCSFSNIH